RRLPPPPSRIHPTAGIPPPSAVFPPFSVPGRATANRAGDQLERRRGRGRVAARIGGDQRGGGRRRGSRARRSRRRAPAASGGVMPVPPSPLEVRREQLDTMVNGYSDVGFVQRKPGRGDTTLSVSCFDKITRWCVVGIQGALLSHILEPLYLSTITIGQSPDAAPEGFCIEDNVVKVLGARLSCLSGKVPDPLKPSKSHYFLRHLFPLKNFNRLQEIYPL
uniref:A to I editase domain-containing protein n=1 Tax=Aegilops tauschii subsp. strangulata TaxID=200361 RepID=A0A453DIE8_AEGTS